MQRKDTDRSQRSRKATRERRRTRRRFGPLLVLLGSVVLLAVVWRLYEQRRALEPEPSTPTSIASPVGNYDLDRELWLANAPEKPIADRLFGDDAFAMDLSANGTASIGQRSPTGQLERTESGSWRRNADGLHLDFDKGNLTRGQVTDTGLEFRAPELGQMVFVRRSTRPPR